MTVEPLGSLSSRLLTDRIYIFTVYRIPGGYRLTPPGLKVHSGNIGFSFLFGYHRFLGAALFLLFHILFNLIEELLKVLFDNGAFSYSGLLVLGNLYLFVTESFGYMVEVLLPGMFAAVCLYKFDGFVVLSESRFVELAVLQRFDNTLDH